MPPFDDVFFLLFSSSDDLDKPFTPHFPTTQRDSFLRTDIQLRGSSSRATTSGSGEGGDGNGNGGGTNEDDEEDCSGSTALCMCLMGGELIVANAGDCRAVMSRRGKAIDLSTDQRPSCSTELARIERAGGFVEDGYINGHLGVSRAFGDFHIEGLKGDPDGGEPGPLIVEPEVERWSLRSEDEFIIVACDGLWDVFSSQNAVDFARQALRKHNNAELAARELTAEALRRDSADNVSVIVVCFSDAPPPDKVQEKRTAPRGSFTRAISVEGLTELQKALKSDDEAAIVAAQTTPKLQRVNSINPRSRGFEGGGGVGEGGGRGGMGRGMSVEFMGALDSMHLDVGGEATGSSGDGNAIGSRRGSGDVTDSLSPLAEE